METGYRKNRLRKIAALMGKGLLTLAVTAACLLLMFGLLRNVLLSGQTTESTGQNAPDEAMMDRYDMYMTNQISDALNGVLSIEKVYWLKDEDIIAPEPDQDKFGTTTDPSTLQWFLDDAAELLDGQETLFTTQTKLLRGSEVTYYLDETIMVITWKCPINGANYTFSEVKIAHPSQFRRFLADGRYGSDKHYYTTQMAASVNAVTASNGDFYMYRPYGIIVYNGEVYRADGRVDTCFIDEQGEMIFVRRGEITDMETAQKFVDENNIRFSLAFGPVLIENYENVVPANYPLGEVNNNYTRSALAKLGDLHYLLVVNSFEGGYESMPTTRSFANVLVSMGIEKAYSLDGGQTGVIVTNDKLISRPNFGWQRTVSDIIYFATAIPDGG